MDKQTIQRNVLFTSAFGCLIIFLQTLNVVVSLVWGILMGWTLLKYRETAGRFLKTNLLFSIGFILYLYIRKQWLTEIDSREWRLFLDRLSLSLILIPFIWQAFRKKISLIKYWNKPFWNEVIYFPFIWSGFHKVKIKFFLIIALSINMAVMMPFMMTKGLPYIQSVLLLAFIFAITNATLEELIWRGVLLSRFSEQAGEKAAVLLTSLGFGLQHYSLGFPWLVCIGFAIGGLFYGGITIQSRSLFPAWLWHLVLNFLMVFSGLIL